MFETQDQDHIDEKIESKNSWKSDASSQEDQDRVEEGVAHPKHEEREQSTQAARSLHSLELRRTASNALSRIASRITTRSNAQPPPPPDGGIKAWTQVAMGWLVILITWGWVNSYGAFQSYYSLNLTESASTISWIGSVQNFLTFFIGAFSGRLLDAGLFLPTFIVGACIQVLGIFMMSLSTTYWQLFLTQGIMTGLGGGIFFTPCMGLIGTYFSKRRALALGLASSGNAAGGMIYPVLVQQLLPKMGFAWTVRILGFLNLGIIAVILCFIRPRLPPRKSGPFVDFSAFKEQTYAFFVAGLFFMVWPIYYTFYYLSSYGTEVIGMPLSTAITLTIIVNGVGLPSRIIPPCFADCFGQLNTMVPVLCCLTLVAWCWIAVSSSAGLYAYAVAYGIVSAATQCLLPSTVASITPDMSMFGTRLGMAFSTLSFAALTGPSLGGAIQSAMGGQYLGAQIWAALSTVICAMLLFASRCTIAGWKLRGVKC